MAQHVPSLQDIRNRHLARVPALHRRRNLDAYDCMSSREPRIFPALEHVDACRVKVLPGANDSCGARLGEDEGAGGARGEVEEGWLVAVVGLGVADDDEVGGWEVGEGGDGGGGAVGCRGEFGVEDLRGAVEPGVQEDEEGGRGGGEVRRRGAGEGEEEGGVGV